MTQVIKIAIVGAECTGKSTLTQELATRLNHQYPCQWVPEYLRMFSEREQRTPFEHEQILIAKAQKALEQDLEKNLLKDSSKPYALLLCDTTPLLTNVYSQIVFGKPDRLVQEMAHHDDYNLTLLTSIDFPWIADGMRDGPEAQIATHQLLNQRLDELKIAYESITGNLEERLETAQNLIENLVLKLHTESATKNSL